VATIYIVVPCRAKDKLSVIRDFFWEWVNAQTVGQLTLPGPVWRMLHLKVCTFIEKLIGIHPIHFHIVKRKCFLMHEEYLEAYQCCASLLLGPFKPLYLTYTGKACVSKPLLLSSGMRRIHTDEKAAIPHHWREQRNTWLHIWVTDSTEKLFSHIEGVCMCVCVRVYACVCVCACVHQGCSNWITIVINYIMNTVFLVQ